MVITLLEAHIASDRIDDLKRGYHEAIEHVPPNIVETFLVRDSGDPTLFRIITVWPGRKALDDMRASVDKPKGVLIFEGAGATPQLSILDVVDHASSNLA